RRRGQHHGDEHNDGSLGMGRRQRGARVAPGALVHRRTGIQEHDHLHGGRSHHHGERRPAPRARYSHSAGPQLEAGRHMARHPSFVHSLPSRQQGATLVVALILLGVLMLSGLAAMYSSSSQFRMAGNMQYRTIAMNQAETATAAAESWLASGTNYLATGF